MAVAELIVSRRTLLGAAFAVPVAVANAVYAQSTELQASEAWTSALAALRRAEATVETFRVDHMHRASHAFHAVRRRWPIGYDFGSDRAAALEVEAALAAYEPFEERLNDLESEEFEAVLHLLRTRSPDLPALATKINLAADYSLIDLEGGDECLAALKADANRLIGSTGRGRANK